jgi:hypothetical protein
MPNLRRLRVGAAEQDEDGKADEGDAQPEMVLNHHFPAI